MGIFFKFSFHFVFQNYINMNFDSADSYGFNFEHQYQTSNDNFHQQHVSSIPGIIFIAPSIYQSAYHSIS